MYSVRLKGKSGRTKGLEEEEEQTTSVSGSDQVTNLEGPEGPCPPSVHSPIELTSLQEGDRLQCKPKV